MENVIIYLLVLTMLSNGSSLIAPPQVPIVLQGGSIGECSHYGPWWASERTPVYAHERDLKHVAFYLKPRERFKALTGNIHTIALGWFIVPQGRPIVVHGHDTYEKTLKVGEKIWLTRYSSEGEWDGWYRGHEIYVDLSEWTVLGDTVIHRPQTEWWVLVKNQQGRTGWFSMERSPYPWGTDACGYVPDWAREDLKRHPER